MKAIKAIDKRPVLVDVPEPGGEGVKVKVVSSSICGSDIEFMAHGAEYSYRQFDRTAGGGSARLRSYSCARG